MTERVVDVLAKESTKGLPVMLCRDDRFSMLPPTISQELLYEETKFWKIYGNKVLIELGDK